MSRIVIEGAIRAKLIRDEGEGPIESISEVEVLLPHGARLIASGTCDGMDIDYIGMPSRPASSTGMLYDLEHHADGTLVDHSTNPPTVTLRKMTDVLALKGQALHEIEQAMANHRVDTVNFGGLTITRNR